MLYWRDIEQRQSQTPLSFNHGYLALHNRPMFEVYLSIHQHGLPKRITAWCWKNYNKTAKAYHAGEIDDLRAVSE